MQPMEPRYVITVSGLSRLEALELEEELDTNMPDSAAGMRVEVQSEAAPHERAGEPGTIFLIITLAAITAPVAVGLAVRLARPLREHKRKAVLTIETPEGKKIHVDISDSLRQSGKIEPEVARALGEAGHMNSGVLNNLVSQLTKGVDGSSGNGNPSGGN